MGKCQAKKSMKPLNGYVKPSHTGVHRFTSHTLMREVHCDNGKIYYGIPKGVFDSSEIRAWQFRVAKILVPIEDSEILQIPTIFTSDQNRKLLTASSSTGTYTIVKPRTLVSEACDDSIEVRSLSW